MRFAAALLAGLLAATPLHAQHAAPLTLDELNRLPEDALARRLFGPLAPDMVLSNRPVETSALFFLPVRLWAWTRPRPSSRPGVCATDRSILYLSVDRVENLGAQGGNRTLRLTGIETQTYYILHNRELAEGRGGPVPEGWGDGCRDLDPRRDGTPADSPWQLLRARALVNDLGAAARAGQSQIPLDCAGIHRNSDPPADEAACLREIRHLRADLVDWVSECRGVPAANNCIRVLSQNLFIEFSLNIGQQAIAITVVSVEDNSAVE